jgi:hypothetical protein
MRDRGLGGCMAGAQQALLETIVRVLDTVRGGRSGAKQQAHHQH